MAVLTWVRREGSPGIEWFKEEAIQSKCSCVSGAHQDPGEGADISSNAPQGEFVIQR